MSAPYQQGQRITNGAVLHRIPNWRSHFNEDTGRPEVPAFQPRVPQDRDALSGHLEALVSVDVVFHFMDGDEDLRNFGLCRLDVARIGAETGGNVRVEYRTFSQRGLGPFHVVIRPCLEFETQLALARIAEVIRAPKNLKDRASGGG